MHIKMPKVAVMKPNQKKKLVNVNTSHEASLLLHANLRPFSRKTPASCEWANERAQRRKYEAVFETVPKTNSIVSII